MKKSFGVAALLLTTLICLFLGAEQLGLMKAGRTTLLGIYALTLFYYGVLAFASATMAGDGIAKKFYRWNPEYDDRWTGYAAGDSYVRRGYGLRLVLHLFFQAPLLYFGTLWVFA